jgi:predicted AAA+ superfamily ATPase
MIANETLKDVIVSQRAALESMDPGTSREQETTIHTSFALAITGVRRCGKSTFLHQLLKRQKKAYYLNLEDPRLDGFDLSDFHRTEEIMRELHGPGGTYFFDEIQAVAKWEMFIRYLVDRKENVVVTGSNASLLSREFGTKLTGRHLQTEIFPFSYKEFLALKKMTPSITTFEEYLNNGGFPEYIKQENPEILQELLSDVVMKDIAIRFSIKNTSILKKMAIHLTSNVGKEFSYNSVRHMLGIKSVQSVIDYMHYFENAYLLFTVPRFSYSYKQQQINPKKAYSIDNGFARNNSASFSKDKGKMLENAVFLALRRKHKDIFYYQEKTECDFIIKEHEKITTAIQVCHDLNDGTRDREISGLIAALEEFDLDEGLILTYSQEDEFLIEGKKIIVKPVWKWLSAI